MAEYIEREALPSCNECIHNGVCGLQERCFDIELQLKEFGCDDFKPTADVASVVHGEWIDCKCSVCNKTSPTLYLDEYEMEYRIRKTPYCPNCGAKMDGKGDNDG